MRFLRFALAVLVPPAVFWGCSISSGTPLDEEAEGLPQTSRSASGGSDQQQPGEGSAPPIGAGGETQDETGQNAMASTGGSATILPLGLRLNEMTRGSAAYVELTNDGNEPVSLAGIVIAFGQTVVSYEPSCQLEEGSLAPGEFFVVTKHGECPASWGPCQPGCDIAPVLAQSSVAHSDEMFLFFGTELLDQVRLPPNAEFPIAGSSWSRLPDDSQWAPRQVSPGDVND